MKISVYVLYIYIYIFINPFLSLTAAKLAIEVRGYGAQSRSDKNNEVTLRPTTNERVKLVTDDRGNNQSSQPINRRTVLTKDGYVDLKLPMKRFLVSSMWKPKICLSLLILDLIKTAGSL